MPPSFTSQPTNEVRVPRKRKAPLDDNGDPVILNPSKRKKTDLSKEPVPQKKKSIPEKLAPARRRPSIEIEEVPDKGDTTYSERPHNPRNILEAANGSDDDVGGALPEVISVDTNSDKEDLPKIEDEDEDEEAELGMYLFWNGL